jgi:serine/threonine-protein kinase HipA
MTGKTDIWVYAHWAGMPEPKCIGILSAQQAKSKKAFSFEYDRLWLASKEQLLLDPDIEWFAGPQYPGKKENFGVFLDSMPDTWGRTLMKRRAAIAAKEQKKPLSTLYDIDYLLGVYDESRMGALRFKLNPDGPFLDDNAEFPTPPWSTVRELQHGADILESDEDSKEVKKWLTVLMAPGSSLGGARPKANIRDDQNNLWIAKFPSRNDTIDKGAWEYLAYELGKKAGIDMAMARMQQVTGKHHTFFTKRFDRINGERVHFASAMTMTGNNEDTIRDNPASYLDLALFLQNHGTDVAANLRQLWRRLVFNIAISNTDDHLRNHGFILQKEGWVLSPAYDINPSIDKDSLSLTIDGNSGSLDFDLAISVGEYFRLDNKEMHTIKETVIAAVAGWQKVAVKLGITRAEQELMSAAFRTA